MPQLQTKRKEQQDILQRAGEYLMQGLERARSGFIAGQRAQEALGQGQLEQAGKVLGTGMNRVETARQLTNVMDKWSRGEATSEEKRGIIDAYMRHAALIGGGTVYHGTPHEWEGMKPDISKVGTGQGAQSYGRGLYFAESPEVAKNYQPQDLIPVIKDRGGNVVARGYKDVTQFDRSLPNPQIKNTVLTYENTGAMYRADIPDEHIAKMLDWDKPLSEQAPEVKSALDRFHQDYGLADITPAMTGKDIYQTFENTVGATSASGVQRNVSQDVSQLLNKYGIPGIKYLDQGSRANPAMEEALSNAQKLLPQTTDAARRATLQAHINDLTQRLQKGTTRNFVVFDPEIVGKVEKVQ